MSGVSENIGKELATTNEYEDRESTTTEVRVNDGDLHSEEDEEEEEETLSQAKRYDSFQMGQSQQEDDEVDGPGDINGIGQPMTSEEVLQGTEMINCEKTTERLITELLFHEEAVAVECKGLNNKAILLQLATMTGSCFIFDFFTNQKLMTEGRLADLLTSTTVIKDFYSPNEGTNFKVMHNCRQTSYILYKQFNIRLSNVFDTQCAYTMIESRRTRLPPSSLRSMSRGFISNVFGRCLPLPATNAISRSLQQNPGAWTERPLPRPQLECAAREVLCLVPEAFLCLKKQITVDMLDGFQLLIAKNLDVEKTWGLMNGRNRQRTLEMIRRYQHKIQKLYETLYVEQADKDEDGQIDDETCEDMIFASTSTLAQTTACSAPRLVDVTMKSNISCGSILKKVESKLNKLHQMKRAAGLDVVKTLRCSESRGTPRRVAELLREFELKLAKKAEEEGAANPESPKVESPKSEYFTSRTSSEPLRAEKSVTAVNAQSLDGNVLTLPLLKDQNTCAENASKRIRSTISQYQETMDYLQRRLTSIQGQEKNETISLQSQPAIENLCMNPYSGPGLNSSANPLSPQTQSAAKSPLSTASSPSPPRPASHWSDTLSSPNFKSVSSTSARKQSSMGDFSVQMELLNLIKNYQQMIQELYKQLQQGRKALEQRDLAKKLKCSHNSYPSINRKRDGRWNKTSAPSCSHKNEKTWRHCRNVSSVTSEKTAAGDNGFQGNISLDHCSDSDDDSLSIFLQELPNDIDTDDDNIESRPQKTPGRRSGRMTKMAKIASRWKNVQWECPPTLQVYHRLSSLHPKKAYYSAPKVDLRNLNYSHIKNGLVESTNTASTSTIAQNQRIRKLTFAKSRKCWEPLTSSSSSSTDERFLHRLNPNMNHVSGPCTVQFKIHNTPRLQQKSDTPRTYVINAEENIVSPEEQEFFLNTPSSKTAGQLGEDEFSSDTLATKDLIVQNRRVESRTDLQVPCCRRHSRQETVGGGQSSVASTRSRTSRARAKGSYHRAASCFFTVEDNYSDDASLPQSSHKRARRTNRLSTQSEESSTRNHYRAKQRNSQRSTSRERQRAGECC